MIIWFNAKLTEIFGKTLRPHGAGGCSSCMVQVCTDPLGTGLERRQLCCSSVAAALQIDTSLSICSQSSPALFLHPPTAGGDGSSSTRSPARGISGPATGMSPAANIWSHFPVSAPSAASCVLASAAASPRPCTPSQHLCPALIHFNKVKTPVSIWFLPP